MVRTILISKMEKIFPKIKLTSWSHSSSQETMTWSLSVFQGMITMVIWRLQDRITWSLFRLLIVPIAQLPKYLRLRLVSFPLARLTCYNLFKRSTTKWSVLITTSPQRRQSIIRGTLSSRKRWRDFIRSIVRLPRNLLKSSKSLLLKWAAVLPQESMVGILI